MLVEIRPLPEKKWHGKTGKDSFARPKDVEVLYDKNTGKYATGLDDKETEEYSKLLGVDLSNVFNPNEPHPYFSTKAATIRLENHTMILNTNRPAEHVKLKNLKASKLVANSLREWEEGKWPEATHVIFDEEEEVNMKASKQALKDECVVAKMKMTDDDKANMIQILGKKTVKGRSADFLNVELSVLIEEDPTQFLKYVRMGREETYVRAGVLEAIHKNILTKEGGSVYYMGELIGFDYEEAVSWFRNPQNNKMKVAILEKLTATKS